MQLGKEIIETIIIGLWYDMAIKQFETDGWKPEKDVEKLEN